MKLFEPWKFKFENSDWASNPEFGLIDTILEKNPHFYEIVAADITAGNKDGNFDEGTILRP